MASNGVGKIRYHCIERYTTGLYNPNPPAFALALSRTLRASCALAPPPYASCALLRTPYASSTRVLHALASALEAKRTRTLRPHAYCLRMSRPRIPRAAVLPCPRASRFLSSRTICPALGGFDVSMPRSCSCVLRMYETYLSCGEQTE